MKNDSAKKSFYEENFSDFTSKIMLNRDKDKNNPFANGLFFGTSSSGMSAIKLEQIKKTFKNIEEITSNKENPEIKSKQKEG